MLKYFCIFHPAELEVNFDFCDEISFVFYFYQWVDAFRASSPLKNPQISYIHFNIQS